MSPFEVNVTYTLFKNLPKKVISGLGRFLGEAGPAILIGIGVYTWANKKHKEIAFHHRS